MEKKGTGFLGKVFGEEEKVFSAAGFTNALETIGKGTLKEMFGVKKVAELERLGRILHLSTTRSNLSGGIVAANIALHPFQNLGKLLRLRLMAQLLNTEKGIQWLTVGIAQGPKSQAGLTALSKLSTQVNLLVTERENIAKQKLIQPIPR